MRLVSTIKAQEADLQKAAKQTGVPINCIKAVLYKESNGVVFWNLSKFADPVPPLNFEGHWFRKLTKGRYDAEAPSLSLSFADRLFGITEWERFQKAEALNRKAAIESCGWGAFQIMGFHWKMCGFKSADDFARAMHTVEGQVKAFVGFLENHWVKGLKKALINRDWPTVAYYYNGPAHAKNRYVEGLIKYYNMAQAGKI